MEVVGSLEAAVMVVEIQQHQILCGSPTPPEAPDYDDWLQ